MYNEIKTMMMMMINNRYLNRCKTRNDYYDIQCTLVLSSLFSFFFIKAANKYIYKYNDDERKNDEKKPLNVCVCVCNRHRENIQMNE